MLFCYYSFAVYFEGRYISVSPVMLRIALAVQGLLWLRENVIVWLCISVNNAIVCFPSHCTDPVVQAF